VVADLNTTEGDAFVSATEHAGGRAAFVEANVADEDAVDAAVRSTVERFEAVDILVNSAGGPTDSWSAGIDLFLKGTYYACRHALPEMERHGGGVIINIGSIASIRGSNLGGVDQTAYPTAKHAVAGLTKSLALAYGPKGIRVNAICPGYIKTPLTKRFYEAPDADRIIREDLRVPLGRFGEADEIGKVAAFLASDDASYISGQLIVVDGGMTAR
jgi:NAD(P)-dependent dehydrogenase (short-subunit alcohol dehydrogenase family)